MSIEDLADLLSGARRVVAFTGAGISTESGIPDFRGPQGLWTKMDPNEFTIQNYVSNPEHRKKVWRMRLERTSVAYEPNAAHRAIAELERLGVVDCVITQNIDGLHQDAGSTIVLEVHGTTKEIKCLDCAARMPNEPVFERVRAGEEDPHCLDCGGMLKSATISFGEAMPADVVDESYRRAEGADVCLVVGSSLVVYPAADIPVATVRAGGRLAIVNAEDTPLDGLAAVVVAGKAGNVLPPVVERVRVARTT